MNLQRNTDYTLTTHAGTFRCRYLATQWNKYTGRFYLILQPEQGNEVELPVEDVQGLETR